MERTEKLKTVKIKGKEYTEVNERLLFLAKNFDYEIDTDFKFYENQNMWVVKAILKMHSDQGCRIYTGVAQEIIGDGYINKTSALENCETSAVGRACAMAGIGVIESIASVDEINKAKAREGYNDVSQPWLKKNDKQNNLTPEWMNVINAISECKITSVLEIIKHYKLSKELTLELEQLINFQTA